MKRLISVFLCHSSEDKPFVRELAKRLNENNILVWLDEAEIKIGDSLVDKIAKGVQYTDFLIVVLSKKSVASTWVQKEFNLAMHKEISKNKVVVLPVKVDNCTIPPILIDKVFADFSEKEKFEESLIKLLQALGINEISMFEEDTRNKGNNHNSWGNEESPDDEKSKRQGFQLYFSEEYPIKYQTKYVNIVNNSKLFLVARVVAIIYFGLSSLVLSFVFGDPKNSLLIFIVYATTIVLVIFAWKRKKLSNNKPLPALPSIPTDHQINNWIEEDLRIVNQKAIHKMNIDKCDLINEPIIITGLKLSKNSNYNIYYHIGSDNIIRISLIDIMICIFTWTSIFIYNCTFDLRTGTTYHENLVTCEKGRVIVELQERDEMIDIRGWGAEKYPDSKIFQITLPNGKTVSSLLSSPKLANEMGGHIPISKAENAVKKIMSMRYI